MSTQNNEDFFTRAVMKDVCPICDNTHRILRPGLVLRDHPQYRRLKRIRGMPCPVCDPDGAGRFTQAERQKAIDALMVLAKVPVKLRGATLDDFCVDAEMLGQAGLRAEGVAARVAWKEKLSGYIAGLASHMDKGIGLSLHGTVGTGKTLAMCIVARAATQLGQSVVLIPERGIFDAIKASYDGNIGQSESQICAQFARVAMLIIDDFGVRRSTDWVVEVYHGIIDSRWDDNRPTLISSNVNLADLRTRYLRQMDRLARNWEIEMVGASLRGTILEK